MKGLLLVNKPKGKTSFSLVAELRHLLKEKKIGHAGTLDPFATGVMVMMVGRAFTKMSAQFLNDDKEYLAKAFLGTATDTFDCDGVITDTSSIIPTLDAINQALTYFQGTILQMPPMFSAKKIGGKRLYSFARKGLLVERTPVPITLKTELISYQYPYLEFKVNCSKGTYIRSIADELGKMLGTYAHLVELTRTQSGKFHLQECLEWEKISSSLLQETDAGMIRCSL